jgi:putative oxidoreductase
MNTVTKFFTHPVLVVLFRLSIGITFIYASYYKVIDPFEFAKSIHHYLLVPTSLINLAALILPWLELFCGLMLILGVLTRANALIILVLLGVFLFAIISVMIRGIDIECGCFKNSTTYQQSLASSGSGTEFTAKAFTEKVGWPLLLRDILLLFMCFAIIGAPQSPLAIDYLWSRKREFQFSTRPA